MSKENNLNWLQKARDSWGQNGNERPSFAIQPKEGQRSVWDFPRPPKIEDVNKRVSVKHQGKSIVDTKDAKAVLETASPPTYYIPEQDVEISQLTKIPGKSSFCEWKGNAEYWALRTDIDNPVAWSYPSPFEEFEKIKNHFGFYPQRLDCEVDGEKVTSQPGSFYAGWITPDLVGPFKGEKGTESW